MRSALIFTLFSVSAAASDFDHDGTEERFVQREGKAVIESFDGKSKTWKDSDFQLPAGIPFSAIDAGSLHFLDLNGDGFEDLLFSDETQFQIALWSTKVRPGLGWTKGWTQPVRSGKRTGSAGEPPSLRGADLRIREDGLFVTASNEEQSRISLTSLLAFETAPPLSPTDALGTFRLPEGFEIELAAAEPQIVDPASFQWGADGRLWVVEMRDYPSGIDGQEKPGGVVKLLEDQPPFSPRSSGPRAASRPSRQKQIPSSKQA